MTKSSRLADITHSGSAGWAVFKGTVKEASGSVKAVWDSDAMPDATLSLDVGTEITLGLFMGDAGTSYQFPAVIETLSHQVNNQTGCVTYDFTFKSTGAVTGPS